MEAETRNAMSRLGIPAEIDLSKYSSVVDIYEKSVEKYGDKPAYSSLGHTLSFNDLRDHAYQFASYLQQHSGLKPGDRVAIQMPNLIQYPVILYGAMLAGMVIVNTNPLYQPRELEHQLKDSGAKLLVVLANVADTAAKVVAKTAVEKVLITELADFHPLHKRVAINLAAKHLKNLVPDVEIDIALPFLKALSMADVTQFRPVTTNQEQLAALQYTGGTTGVAKGAMLSHRNLVANTLQCKGLFDTYGLQCGEETIVLPLPFYHIYSFTVGTVMMEQGNHCVLIPDPRNLELLVKIIKRYGMSFFCGINTLFVSLCNEEDFQDLDFSNLKLTLSGGMALTEDAAKQWLQVTGVEVHQGYGLTETSPVLSANPGGGNKANSIGLPLPATQLLIRNEQGKALAVGEAGELCARGPQVMAGYWQRPEATAEVLDDEGWFATGDIAILDPDGYYRIVDRKKDMIIVSGFNVYPNELDDVISEHPGVLECAAIGVPDALSGEAVVMFVVKADPSLTEPVLRDYSRQQLTGYKVPNKFVFVDDLPKSAVGKILRRELRAKA